MLSTRRRDVTIGASSPAGALATGVGLVSVMLGVLLEDDHRRAMTLA